MRPEQIASRVVLTVLAVGALCVSKVAVAAEECESLEGSAQTVCLTLMVCMSLNEDKARDQCLLVARQLLSKNVRGGIDEAIISQVEEAAKQRPRIPGLPEQEASEETDDVAQSVETSELMQTESKASPQSVTPDTVIPSPNLEDEVSSDSPVEEQPSLIAIPVTKTATTQPPSSGDGQEMTVQDILNEGSRDSSKRRGLFGWLRPKSVNDEIEISERVNAGLTLDGIPKRFAATVVDVAKVDYNDSLVVLSNGYVFTIKRARESRISDNDVVVVEKKEGLSGRKAFRFYGQGGSVDASRVLCEHVDPSVQTRRRCAYAERKLEPD